MGGYFFQPRAISHNGFIAAADWFRRIHEEAENEQDKEETAEGDEAVNLDDAEETPDGGHQRADTGTTLPTLDPDHTSNPEAPPTPEPLVPCLAHGEL